MRLPELSIKNSQFVIILIFLALAMGLLSIVTMPRSEDPNPKFPFYTVIAIYPGTSPEDIEELVVNPLEDEIDLIDDIEEIKTKIEEGVAVISVESKFGIDTDDKFDDIEAAVKSVEASLPNLYSLDVIKFEPNTRVSIQQLAIYSDKMNLVELNSYAENLEEIIEKVKGVEEVKIEAMPNEIIKVKIDYDKMSNLKISTNQLIQVLNQNNLNIPAGDLPAGDLSFSIKTSGSYKKIDQIKNTVVVSRNGGNILINDIADVFYDIAEDNWIAEYKKNRVIYLTITQEEGNNIVDVGKRINNTINEFKLSNQKITIANVFEQAPAVENRINDFVSNLLQGVLLVGVIVFLFLGFKSSVIIMTVIPLSIIIAISMLDFNEYSLQQISIAGLVIALGLLVDNGIVVVENIQRFLKEGYNIKDAAIKGTGEVGYAIISSTITTLLAFYPLANLNSGAGEFVRTLPLIVIFTLIASLILALTFTPIISKLLLKNKIQKGFLDKYLDLIINKVYEPILRAALKRGWLFIAGGTVLLVFSMSLFPSIGVSFFPTADKSMLLIEVNSPRGSDIKRTQKALDFVTQKLDSIEFVKDYTTNAGHGNPMIYYNRVNENYKKYHGQVLVNFDEWNPTKFYEILNQLRQEFSDYYDAKITFQELKNGPPFEAPIEIKIIGEELKILKEYSFKLEEIISNTEGITDVDNPLRTPKIDLKIDINEQKALRYGINLAQIDQSIRVAIDGWKIDELTINQNEYELIVQQNEKSSTVDELRNIYLTNINGKKIPLEHIADIKLESSLTEILHYNKERSIAVKANVFNPEKVTQITEAIIAKLDDIQLPEGYEFFIAGEYEGQQDSFGDLGKLLFVALMGIFAVLVLQFKSIKQPLIIFAAIPLAVTGSFIALFLTGWSFSFFAFVGFNSLIGIVVNNSIILVDYTNQLISEGKPKIDAIIEAGKTRFTPIILTSTTTVLGLIPLTFQGTSLWSPLGWTIIGGMFSSTLLTLTIVPILYKWFTSKRELI